ncbi:MAG: TlpA family protein disulfide reductase [Propionibacteriales bacterium]|nr:TlpA family protein disulfide reductase [Propionibacteriales bacterium]
MSPAPRLSVRRLAAALVAGVSVTAMSACTTSGPGSGNTGYITGDGVVTTIAPEDRTSVPDVRGVTLSGGTLDISGETGKVVVVNVWASWCPPCRAEAADLVAAARRLRSVTFIGIDTREDNASAARAFVREHAIPYDSIYDQDGSAMLSFYGMLSPSSLPSTMVIDTQGRIAALVLGRVSTSTLVGLVHDVAGES